MVIYREKKRQTISGLPAGRVGICLVRKENLLESLAIFLRGACFCQATTPFRNLEVVGQRSRDALDLREVKLGVVALDDSLAVLVALGELEIASVGRIVGDILRLRLHEHVEGLTLQGLERLGHVDVGVVVGQTVIQTNGLQRRGKKLERAIDAVLVLEHDIHVALRAEGLIGGAGGGGSLGRHDLALTDNHLESLAALASLGLVDENLIDVGGDESELDFSTFFHFVFVILFFVFLRQSEEAFVGPIILRLY